MAKQLNHRQLERAAAHWDRATLQNWKGGTGLYWTDLEPVRRRLRFKASGDPNVEWYECVVRRFLGRSIPLERIASLGCGEGILERRLNEMGVFKHCDAFDISPVALERARAEAKARGMSNIAYRTADLNTLTLPCCSYQAVFAESSIHHVQNLEWLFGQIQRALVPGGWLFANEYVGPSRFQFPDAQLRAMNAALQLLPDRYKVSLRAANPNLAQPRETAGTFLLRLWMRLRHGGLVGAVRRRFSRLFCAAAGRRILKGEVRRPDPFQLQISDPSEAVRSQEILELLPNYLRIVEVRPLGGALLHFLLDDIAGNFNPERREDSRLLEMLFEVEDALTEAGILQNDFAVIAAQKDPG
jgi:SAM-dependent methyltransferase